MTRDQHLEHLRQQQAKKLAEKLKQEHNALVADILCEWSQWRANRRKAAA